MSRAKSGSYRTSGVKAKRSVSSVTKTTRELSEGIAISLRAQVEPVVLLPQSIQTLQQQGRTQDVPKLMQLTKIIASDFDTFSAEREVLNTKFENLVKNKPAERSAQAEHHLNISMMGLEFMGLNDRIMQTMMKANTDYSEILKQPQEAARG